MVALPARAETVAWLTIELAHPGAGAAVDNATGPGAVAGAESHERANYPEHKFDVMPTPPWTRWFPLLYLVFGITWILASDSVVGWIFGGTPHLLLLASTVKGFAFVAFTAFVLAWWWRSERRRTTELLQGAESLANVAAERLAWMSRHASDVILLLDYDGHILDCNETAEHSYGYTRDELLGMTGFQLRQQGDVASRHREQLRAVQTEGHLTFEAVHVRKDGSTFPVEVSSTRIAFEGRTYIQSIVRDISERRHLEQRAAQSAAERDRLLVRLKLQFDSMPIGCAVVADGTLRLLDVNPEFERIFGWSKAELCEADALALVVPPEIHSEMVDWLARTIESGRTQTSVNQNLTRSGRRITCRWTNVPLRDPNARTLGMLAMCQDVTANMEAEQALQDSEARYRGLFEQASDATFLVDAQHRFLDANPEALRMLGYSRDELLEKCLPAILGDTGSGPQVTTAPDRVTGGSHREQWQAMRKDGTTFPADASIRALELGRHIVTLRDQTEIVEARRRIERHRDLYELLSRCNHVVGRVTDRQSLFDSITRLAVERGGFLFAWIGEVQPDGDIIKSAAAGNDGGYVAKVRVSARAGEPSGEGPIGRALRGGVTAVSNRFLQERATSPWHAMARERGVHSAAAIPIRTRGEVTAALMLYAPLPDFFDAEIVGTLEEMAAEIAFGLDGLETRRELQESRGLLQAVIDTSTAPIYVFDREGRALLMNEACAKVMGIARDAAVGRTCEEFLPAAAARAHRAADEQVIRSGTPLALEESMPAADSGVVFLSVRYPLRDLEGRIYGVACVSTDITDLRCAQHDLSDANARLESTVEDRTRELVAARDRAEKADRSKTAFLSTISHELRTPLNSIIGFTDIVLQGLAGPVNVEQQRQLSIVHESAQLLLGLINEVLDLSRIEAGRLQLNLDHFDPQELLRRRAEAMTAQSNSKGLTLECRIDPDLPEMMSDATRVSQIVSNLMSNAIKFTERGGVTLTARRIGSNVEIVVSDTGPGISAQDIERLFRPFEQLGETLHRPRDGTGLGLVISRHLARALGGDILIESALGQGCRFTIVLPVHAPGRLDDSATGLFRKIAPSQVS